MSAAVAMAAFPALSLLIMGLARAEETLREDPDRAPVAH